MTERLDRAWSGVSRPVRAAFFGALIAGLLGHIIGITNFFQNHDGILNFHFVPKTHYGLWFSPVVGALGGEVTVPGIAIVLGVVCIAVSAGLMVSFLGVRSRWMALVAGVMMALFPTVVCTNAYGYSGILSFSSLLLASLAVWCVDRGWPGTVASLVLLTLSLGTDQSHISWAAALLLLRMILEAFRWEGSAWDYVRRGLKYVAVLAGAVVCYYGILQVVLVVTDLELTAYRGVDQMARIRWDELPALLVETYRKVARFFLRDQYGEATAFTAWLYRAMLVCAAGGYALLAARCRLYRRWPMMLFSLILMGLFPLAIHLIAVLGQDADTHWVMIYAFVLLPVMSLVFADRCEQESADRGDSRRSRLDTVASVLAAAALLVGVVQSCAWYVVTDECYTALRLTNSAIYARSVQLCADLTDRGYTADMPLALLGEQAAPYFAPAEGVYSKSQYTGIVSPSFAGDPRHLYLYLRQIVGFPHTQAGEDQIDALCRDEEIFADMPVYPQEGSVRVVDGVMVVKLSGVSSPEQAAP